LGLIEIVNAVKLLQRIDFKVDIYGAGEDEKLVKEYIEDNKLNNLVQLKGSIGTKEKNVILSQADAFLYPSYYPEGLPYAVLESLSYSLPVICTNAGALKDIVVNRETCLKVKEKSSEEPDFYYLLSYLSQYLHLHVYHTAFQYLQKN